MAAHSQFACVCILAILLLLLSAISAIDLRTRTIPNRLVLGVAALGAVSCMLQALGVCAFPAEGIGLGSRIAGIFTASLPLFAIALVSGGFGGGDVKLMAAAGLLLGGRLVLGALGIAVVLGGGYSAVLMAAHRAKRNDSFAFGPALCTGIAVVALGGMLGCF